MKYPSDISEYGVLHCLPFWEYGVLHYLPFGYMVKMLSSLFQRSL